MTLDNIGVILRKAAKLRRGRAKMHQFNAFDWNDLRYFLAVAREGSSHSAAKLLRVNQSTVQRRLAALEYRLGCTLLERHPMGYRLTTAGKELQPYAERVEEAANALQRRVAAFNPGISGSIRLTCPTSVAYRLNKSEFLNNFSKRYPGVRVELLMTERLLSLSKGEADIAIRGGEAREEALIGKRIAEVPWAIYASRSYIDRRGIPKRTEDINRHGIVEFVGEISHLKAARWLKSKAPEAVVSGQSGDVAGALLATKSGAGLAPLPSPLAELDSELVRVFGPIPELSYPLYLFVHRDLRRVTRIAAFFEYCVATLRPILTTVESHKKL